MSTTTLRHHLNALAFLPRQKEDRVLKSLRLLKMRTSRRRLKQTLRQLITLRPILSS